jgi:hypothetical protein
MEAGTLNGAAEFPFSVRFTADPMRGLPYAGVFRLAAKPP